MSTQRIVAAFIEAIWNGQKWEELDTFLAPGFVDHSLPPGFSPDKEGLRRWIINTGESFGHKSIIEDQVTEGDKSIVKIRMHLTHLGAWRDIAPTGRTVSAVGYRCFHLEGSKIVAHWAMVDGNAIENQLRDGAHGCKVQQ